MESGLPWWPVKNLPVTQETWAQFLGQQDPLEKEMATHSSILAWRIPWTEELAGYSPWDHKELDTTEQLRHVHINTQDMRDFRKGLKPRDIS